MNIKDSKKHFDKLSSFYAQVSNDGEVNKIELDLLKSYVLNFYEAITGNSTAAPASTPAIKEVKQEIKKEVAAQEKPVAPKPEIAEIPIAEQAPSENVPSIEKPVKNNQISSDFAALFSLETGNEISDKLSMAPIKDVTKAMNINERIFTIKELFGGNKESFDTTMNKLNEFKSYDEATKYLSEEIVEKNGWLDPTKTKKVKTFLKLVARKYI